MKILEIVELEYDNLTVGEKKVADYFLEKKYDMLDQTLADIAEATQVGEATVVRFCHKLGFESFRHIKLNMDLERGAENFTEPSGYIAAIENRINSSVRKTIEGLDMEALEAAIAMIDEAENVVAIGVAFSGLSAQVLATRFIRVGKLCHYITDSHLQVMYTAWASKANVIIVFSLSGRTNDILETVRIAKTNNVKIIAVTSSVNSPLAKSADIVIQTVSRDGPLNGGNLASVVNQIFVADLLVTGYALLDEDRSITIKRAVHETIIKKMQE